MLKGTSELALNGASEVTPKTMRRIDCSSSSRFQPNVPGRNQHYADSANRRLRVLTITAGIAGAVSGAFGVMQLFFAQGAWFIGVINIATAAAFAAIPLLYRFGELVAPLVFMMLAFASIFFICWFLGTDSGLQLYFLVAASISILTLGIERIALAVLVAAVGVALTITLELTVPDNTGRQPEWANTVGFIVTTISASVIVLATVWYAMREIERAEAAMELEYERSETLLANILPESVAKRLKDPSREIIADKYDDASILFADIAGFTERASDTTPVDLVAFLDQLYTDFDRLVDRHGLEKIKTSGDSYMVVSGVPEPRPDHLEALAMLALEMAETVEGLRDSQGREVPLRIGIGAGPVVAGVVGARKFFYDVWGDAVNIASRMESTDTEGRIQVPQDVYDKLCSTFEFEERGEVDVKGKGFMHTWYLVGAHEPARPREGGRGGPIGQTS